MQFPFLPVGVKWKVVENVHCPPLLIDTGLMSIGPLTKKLLQKHRPVSYSKKRRAGVPTKHATYQIVLPIIYLHCFKGKGRCGRIGLG